MPELFTAQLFTTLPGELDDITAMRDRYVEVFRTQATKHGLFIPTERGDRR